MWFFINKTNIIGLVTSILSIHGSCLKFLWYNPKTLSWKHFFHFSKFWFVAEIQGFKFTPLLQVKSKVHIVRPGHIYTFCLWHMVEIFVVYSSNAKRKALFSMFQNHKRFLRKPQKKNTRKNVIFGCQNHKLSAWPLLYLLFMTDVWFFCYIPKILI